MNGAAGRVLMLRYLLPDRIDMLKERREDIAEYFATQGIPVETRYSKGGLSIYAITGKTPIARSVPTGNGESIEVMWYSHRDRWDHIGDFGVTMSLDIALDYVVREAPGCFGIDFLRAER